VNVGVNVANRPAVCADKPDAPAYQARARARIDFHEEPPRSMRMTPAAASFSARVPRTTGCCAARA
jgi:hypothetical protein